MEVSSYALLAAKGARFDARIARVSKAAADTIYGPRRFAPVLAAQCSAAGGRHPPFRLEAVGDVEVALRRCTLGAPGRELLAPLTDVWVAWRAGCGARRSLA